MSNEMFASYNTMTGMLHAKIDLAMAVDCKTLTDRKKIAAFDIDFSYV